MVPNNSGRRREVALLTALETAFSLPGEHELVSEVVEAGQPAPASLCLAGLPVQGMRSVWILFLTPGVPLERRT